MVTHCDKWSQSYPSVAVYTCKYRNCRCTRLLNYAVRKILLDARIYSNNTKVLKLFVLTAPTRKTAKQYEVSRGIECQTLCSCKHCICRYIELRCQQQSCTVNATAKVFQKCSTSDTAIGHLSVRFILTVTTYTTHQIPHTSAMLCALSVAKYSNQIYSTS